MEVSYVTIKNIGFFFQCLNEKEGDFPVSHETYQEYPDLRSF